MKNYFYMLCVVLLLQGCEEFVAVDAPMDTETGAAPAPAAEAEEGSAVQARDSGAAPPVSTQTVAENSTEIDATEPMVEG